MMQQIPVNQNICTRSCHSNENRRKKLAISIVRCCQSTQKWKHTRAHHYSFIESNVVNFIYFLFLIFSLTRFHLYVRCVYFPQKWTIKCKITQQSLKRQKYTTNEIRLHTQMKWEPQENEEFDTISCSSGWHWKEKRFGAKKKKFMHEKTIIPSPMLQRKMINLCCSSMA